MKPERTGRRRRILRLVIILVGVLVIVRLALPYIVLHYANKSLANMEGYRGHIHDIDIALIRGAYQIDSIYLHKVDTATHKETPFFAASLVDLSVEWKALFKGSIVGEVIVENPLLRFTKDRVEPKQVQKDSSELKTLQDKFMPLKVNRLEIKNGSIQYIDDTAKPKVDVALTRAHVLGENLRNSYDSAGELLPATITARADLYEGSFLVNVKINPLAEVPTFDVNAEVKNTNLVKLNDFFKAYAKADVSRGTFGLYTEIAAKDGKFKGYVKPLIKDLKVLGAEDRKDNLLKKMWEGLVGTVGEIFENQPEGRLATKIPFEGNVENPKANIWYAVGQILQNAFIQALQPSLDQEINIAAVDTAKPEKKNVLEKVFGSEDKSKKQVRKDRRQKKKEERKKRRAAREEDEKSEP